MEEVLSFVKIIVPAALVLYASYLTLNTFLKGQLEQKALAKQAEKQQITLPLRLQAYERMAMFLERISPENLVIRVNQGDLSAQALQQLLLSEIRNEYNHNLSQQVYISHNLWQAILRAKEETNAVINESAGSLEENASSIDLARLLFSHLGQQAEDPIAIALQLLKEEAQQLL